MCRYSVGPHTPMMGRSKYSGFFSTITQQSTATDSNQSKAWGGVRGRAFALLRFWLGVVPDVGPNSVRSALQNIVLVMDPKFRGVGNLIQTDK